jgi:mono/diheme cytochrome c family protein
VNRLGLLSAATIVAAAATFVGWQTDEATPRSPPLDGAALFRAKGCASCHTGPDSSANMSLPSLARASDWAGERRPGLSATEYIIESIRTPSAFISPALTVDGPAMPVLGLTDAEIDALVAYLLRG